MLKNLFKQARTGIQKKNMSVIEICQVLNDYFVNFKIFFILMLYVMIYITMQNFMNEIFCIHKYISHEYVHVSMFMMIYFIYGDYRSMCS